MSPEARTSSTAMTKLAADLRAGRATMRQLASELRAAAAIQADVPEELVASHIAVKLHAFYGSIESTMERVARHLDGSVPTGNEWHKELIRQMTLELSDVRSPVFGDDAAVDLHRLLAFRHFFRHAYAVKLDRSELDRSCAIVDRLWPKLDEALAALERHVLAALATLGNL